MPHMTDSSNITAGLVCLFCMAMNYIAHIKIPEWQQNAAGAWLCDYAEHRQPLDEIKHRHALNEIDDVAEGQFHDKLIIANRM